MNTTQHPFFFFFPTERLPTFIVTPFTCARQTAECITLMASKSRVIHHQRTARIKQQQCGAWPPKGNDMAFDSGLPTSAGCPPNAAVVTPDSRSISRCSPRLSRHPAFKHAAFRMVVSNIWLATRHIITTRFRP